MTREIKITFFSSLVFLLIVSVPLFNGWSLVAKPQGLNSAGVRGGPGPDSGQRGRGNTSAIIPVRAEDKSGRLVAQTSPLEKRIRFPAQERSMKDTLDLILKPLNVTDFVQFRNPTLPRATVGADNEKARDVLGKIFHQPGSAKASWNLIYDPDPRAYFFL
jgi:hypothetical protein